jgi:sugar O-acyltransferase (sialic acid O-acetyltransferase NeuD family)
MERILILGAGGHGRSVAEAIELSGHYRIYGFLDDHWPSSAAVWEYPVVGRMDSIANHLAAIDAVVVAIGNNMLRQQLIKDAMSYGVKLANVIHPSAWVSPRARLGQGVVVMAGAVVGTDAELGDGVIVNCRAVVDHDGRLGDCSHIGVGVSLAGGVHVGTTAFLQAGSAVGAGGQVEPGAIISPGTGVEAAGHR